MFMFKWPITCLEIGVVVIVFVAPAAIAQPHYELGKAVIPAEIQAWNIAVKPDGSGLPLGHGSVGQGKNVYQMHCAACHGANGEGGGIGPRLVGGKGTLDTSHPVKTVGSYWPYATTLFDYIRRAMPFDAPQSLTADEVYAVSAYVLHLNGIIPEDVVMSAKTLPKVKMPNREGFVSPDPRPDTHNVACEHNCK